MPRFLSISCTAMFVLCATIVGPVPRAFADASATTSGDTVSVGVSTGGNSGGSAGSTGSGSSSGSTGGGGASGGGGTVCTPTMLVLNNQLGPPPGVTTPGSWYSITCTDSSGNSTSETVWISSGSSPAAPAAPAVDPRSVALQAENSLTLPSPSISFNPPTNAVVNLATWLWIDPVIWHAYSVSATVGSVSATATALPVSVTWSMGDGSSVDCPGPGSAYQPALPATAQTTDCSYSYSTTSAGQPSANGDPDQGAFVVSATVDWDVSWTAQGAVGGGNLPGLTTTSHVPLRVIQVESVNS